MTNIEWKVGKIRPLNKADSKTKAFLDLELWIDGTLTCVLGDLTLVEGQNGEFLGMPRSKFTGKDDETGQPKEMYKNIIKMYPNKDDWGKMTPLVNLVKQRLSEVQQNGGGRSSGGQHSASAYNNSNNRSSQPAHSAPSSDDLF